MKKNGMRADGYMNIELVKKVKKKDEKRVKKRVKKKGESLSDIKFQ